MFLNFVYILTVAADQDLCSVIHRRRINCARVTSVKLLNLQMAIGLNDYFFMTKA